MVYKELRRCSYEHIFSQESSRNTFCTRNSDGTYCWIILVYYHKDYVLTLSSAALQNQICLVFFTGTEAGQYLLYHKLVTSYL